MSLEEKIRFVCGNNKETFIRHTNSLLVDLFISQWDLNFSTKSKIAGRDANKGILYYELMYKLLKDDAAR